MINNVVVVVVLLKPRSTKYSWSISGEKPEREEIRRTEHYCKHWSDLLLGGLTALTDLVAGEYLGISGI